MINLPAAWPAALPLVPLIVYLVFTFAYTWAFHLCTVSRRLSVANGKGRVLYWLGLPGPTLAAVAVSFAFGSTHQLRHALLINFPVGPLWSLAACSSIPLIYVSATGFHMWRTGRKSTRLFHRPAQGWWALLLGQAFVVCAEEIGWRGFALPALIRIFGSVGGTLVLGLVWALWHLPMFRVPSSHQSGSFWVFAYSLAAWSMIMTTLVTQTGGSILPAMAFHASANIAAFTIDMPPQAERYSAILLGLVSLLLMPLFPSPWISVLP